VLLVIVVTGTVYILLVYSKCLVQMLLEYCMFYLHNLDLVKTNKTMLSIFMNLWFDTGVQL